MPAPVRSSRWRRFVHVPLGKAGVRLLVRCRRYECRGCGGAWEDDLSRVAADGRRLTERAAWWAVASVVLDAMSVRSVAATLGCSWDCANDAVLAKGMKHLAGDEHRLDGVTHLGVDEHVWRHTPRGSRYVTVVVDLTPRRDGRPARLLDVAEGRSGTAFAGWFASRSEEFRRNVRVVAMDAFAGYKHAVMKAVPHAREVLDPFHVVRLAGDKLTQCRQRLQQEATGRRGTKQDPLYRAHRSHQRPARTPARHRPRLHQPRQLHHPKPPARRRIQTNHTKPDQPTMNPDHTHENRKSQITTRTDNCTRPNFY